jgi:hypothetical protein
VTAEHPGVAAMKCNKCGSHRFGLMGPAGKWLMIENTDDIGDEAVYDPENHHIHICK